MRTIKFRAWHKRDKKFLTENVLSDPDHVPVTSHGDNFELGDSKKVIFLQYTGLKDKNGVEIYEGDIVSKRDWLSKELGKPLEVKWAENRTFKADEYGITITGFYLMVKKDDDFYRAVGKNFEVIGNICEMTKTQAKQWGLEHKAEEVLPDSET